MKKLLMVFLSVSILFACNNDKKGVRGFGEKEGGLGGDEDGGWTTKLQNKYLKECMEASGENQKLAKQVCSCVLEKVMKKYTAEEADKDLSEATAIKMAKDCMKTGGGQEDEGYGDDEEGNGFKKKTADDEEGDIDEGAGGARWTNQQRNSYISECATAAETNLGYSADQASSFCECMTRKVEKKHAYKVASQMTVNDFSTQEWENARAACRGDN